MLKCTYFSQQLLLYRIQPSVKLFSDDLEVVVDDHLAEEATCSEQHGHVPIDAVAEGQYDDIRSELRKENCHDKFTLEARNCKTKNIVKLKPKV